MAAGLTATFLGVLADRMGARLQLNLIFGGVLAAFLLSATWQGYAVLLAAALVSGVAQAFSNPVTNRLVAQDVPPGAALRVDGVEAVGRAGGPAGLRPFLPRPGRRGTPSGARPGLPRRAGAARSPW